MVTITPRKTVTIQLHPGEHEDILPSPAEAPRAWAASNAAKLSLNGDWAFRLSPDPYGSEDFADAAFQEEGWNSIPVPSTWVLHGHGAPAYQNIDYPFSIDPPNVPSENPTGDYRFTFARPDWAEGKVSGCSCAACVQGRQQLNEPCGWS